MAAEMDAAPGLSFVSIARRSRRVAAAAARACWKGESREGALEGLGYSGRGVGSAECSTAGGEEAGGEEAGGEEAGGEEAVS